jgi:3-hydroxyacyl-CoA dehydrogenase/3a,7a,12a-trihydroxy-5b-cholest-24-enoyl-CoA hydratase
VGRAVLKTFCDNDPARFKAFECRFSGVVFPGDTIVTQMWKESPTQVLVQAKTQRGDVVLANAAVTIAG